MPDIQTPEELIRKLDHILSARETTEEASMEMAVAEIADRDAAIRREEREAIAITFDERAQGYRNAAATTRRDWCGPDLNEEDRAANRQDARRHDAIAADAEVAARRIRAREPGAVGSSTTPAMGSAAIERG